MNHQSNFNYALFNSFYSDPHSSYAGYAQSYDPSFPEEHDNQEYTFLPKTNFFENYISSPLDVTRQSTEVTETSDNTPLSQKVISPNSVAYPKYNMPEYNPNFPGLSVKPVDLMPKAKFASMLSANGGIPYNAYVSNPEPKFFQEQTPQSSSSPSHVYASASIKIEENLDKHPKIEHTEDQEMEDDQPEGKVLNTQLKSLLESKIWSEEKDQMLLKLGTQYKCDWKKISKRFNNKKITPHFLKIRYKELTCAPLQRRVKFNHKEDLMIAKYFEKYGSNWGQMAVHFTDRTAIMLKNRYYSFIRKRELLASLLQEVREIEKDNREVDGLKDQESEQYSDVYPSKRGLKSDSDHGMGTVCYEMENSLSNELHERITSNPSTLTNEKHTVYGYEERYQQETQTQHKAVGKEENGKAQTAQDENESQTREIMLLRARVKSLQSLYLATKNKLHKLKAKN